MSRSLKQFSASMLTALRRPTAVSIIILTILAGGLTGYVMGFALDHSELALMVTRMSDYQASILSRVYADDGSTVIGEFYLERRVPIDYQDIPESVRNAFISIEDARFYKHYGLDPVRILGAFWENLVKGRIVEGGSTITQQLARGLFLSRERTYSRKIKEAFLALLIERYYTKEQILELYCNQIYLGSNAYGVEAAAQYYFGKSVRELTLSESALLAALPKAPVSYSPIHNKKAARERRNLVLGAMADQGFISQAEAAVAKARPLKLSRSERISNIHSPYAYLVEMVRQQLESKYGTRKTHTGGLQIYTTLNIEDQHAAVRAVRAGLHAYDRRHGWRNHLHNILDEGESLETYNHPDWDTPFEVGNFYTGLVTKVEDHVATVRFGDYMAHVTRSEAPWGRSLRRLVRKGDLTVFRIDEIQENAKMLNVTLLQLPAVQGALVALEVPSGELKALVGGYNFNASWFNRATQGQRQTGSAFKPFIYAAAIEYGLTPDDPVLDAPFRLGEWEPHNYDNEYKGVIPLATAIALSRNIPAVRILQEIEIYRAVRMVERLGLPTPMAPYLPSALGATEEPLLDMVKAYAVFANLGKRVYPHFIRRVLDRDGTELEHWQPPPPEEVISPYVASTMVELMEGVVNHGTAGGVRRHAEFAGWDIGAKTGTVNDFTDAWFLGYTPTVCTGVWIGFDEKKSLGDRESGAVAALPMWVSFMKEFLKGQPPRQFELDDTPPPEMVELQEKRRLQRGTMVLGSGGQVLPGVGGPPSLENLGAGEENQMNPGKESPVPLVMPKPPKESEVLPPASRQAGPAHRQSDD